MAEDKTREALVQSIEKWKDDLNQDSPWDIKLGASACPLCQIFLDIDNRPNYCGDCPINRQNFGTSCNLTPYNAAADVRNEWRQVSHIPGPKFDTAKLNWQNEAARMVRFLEKTLENYDNGQNT